VRRRIAPWEHDARAMTETLRAAFDHLLRFEEEWSRRPDNDRSEFREAWDATLTNNQATVENGTAWFKQWSQSAKAAGADRGSSVASFMVFEWCLPMMILALQVRMFALGLIIGGVTPNQQDEELVAEAMSLSVEIFGTAKLIVEDTPALKRKHLALTESLLDSFYRNGKPLGDIRQRLVARTQAVYGGDPSSGDEGR
jgi:hypothetical protein